MAWVRCCGGAIKKLFTTIYNKTGWTQTINNSVLNGSGSGNFGTDGGYNQNVPVTVATFACNKNFTFYGIIHASGANAYIDLEVYVDGVLIGNTTKDTSATDKTLNLNCNAGTCEVKMNNWRGMASGTANIDYSAM